jgi:hypothetical protein
VSENSNCRWHAQPATSDPSKYSILAIDLKTTLREFVGFLSFFVSLNYIFKKFFQNNLFLKKKMLPTTHLLICSDCSFTVFYFFSSCAFVLSNIIPNMCTISSEVGFNHINMIF